MDALDDFSWLEDGLDSSTSISFATEGTGEVAALAAPAEDGRDEAVLPGRLATTTGDCTGEGSSTAPDRTDEADMGLDCEADDRVGDDAVAGRSEDRAVEGGDRAEDGRLGVMTFEPVERADNMPRMSPEAAEDMEAEGETGPVLRSTEPRLFRLSSRIMSP